MFVDDFGVKFVVVEELSEDVGETSVEVMIVVEKGVEFVGGEGQISNERFVGHFYSQVGRNTRARGGIHASSKFTVTLLGINLVKYEFQGKPGKKNSSQRELDEDHG